MPPKRRKSKELTQQCQLQTRNWSDLPSELLLNILQRVGVVDKLLNVQKVCTAWCKICKDPALWRVIHMESLSDEYEWAYRRMCEEAVDRSQGQLVDLSIIGFGDLELLKHVSKRSSQLRRLELLHFCGSMIWIVAFQNFPLLEELTLDKIQLDKEDIEDAGRYCPLLKTLKVVPNSFRDYSIDEEVWMTIDAKIALAIGKNLPALTHLELKRNRMKDIELKAILDGCCHLETLDLRECNYLNLGGGLWDRCLKQIKHLSLPACFLEGFDYDQWSYYD